MTWVNARSSGAVAGIAFGALGAVGFLAVDPVVKGQLKDDLAQILAERQHQAQLATASDVPGQRRVILVVPACDGNEPTNTVPVDALCPQAAVLCAGTPEPADFMFWFFSGPAGVAAPGPGQWVRTGQSCLLRGAAGRAAVPVFTERDFRRLPLPAGGVRVQPPNLRTLVNVATNVYVEAGVRVLDTTLLGLPVRVRATPVRFRWGFGDGQTLVTSDPGAPYPQLRTTHTYRQPGRRVVTMTTVYTGEYSVAGGAWLPVEGEAQVASPVTTLTVLAAENHLVAGSEP